MAAQKLDFRRMKFKHFDPKSLEILSKNPMPARVYFVVEILKDGGLWGWPHRALNLKWHDLYLDISSSVSLSSSTNRKWMAVIDINHDLVELSHFLQVFDNLAGIRHFCLWDSDKPFPSFGLTGRDYF